MDEIGTKKFFLVSIILVDPFGGLAEGERVNIVQMDEMGSPTHGKPGGIPPHISVSSSTRSMFVTGLTPSRRAHGDSYWKRCRVVGRTLAFGSIGHGFE